MSSKVVIYTQLRCPYCDAAKSLFHSLNVSFQEISFEGNPELRQKLSDENKGWRTAPMIFINEKFVGGFDDVQKLHKNNKLLELLS